MRERSFMGWVLLAITILVLLLVAIPSSAHSHTPNQPGYWGSDCFKIDDYEGGHSWKSDSSYRLVVTKYAQVHQEWHNVSPGDVLTTPKEISHLILCTTSPSTTSLPTTTTQPQETSTTVESSTTTTTVLETTTTTIQPTTSVPPSTSVTSEPTTSTTPTTQPELPATGPEGILFPAIAATLLITTGIAAVKKGDDK